MSGASVVGKLARSIVEWCAEHRLLREHKRLIQNLEENDELGAMLKAEGISRQALAQLKIPPFESDALLNEMLEQLDIGVGEVTPSMMISMQGACRGCNKWTCCRRVLRNASSATRTPIPAFCANAHSFERILAQRIRTAC
ncbi:MAG TPA: DUF6455 family protein [Burkholderiales bacterium]|nr:DUF6455 family protein [Burkholderiales bacterium]